MTLIGLAFNLGQKMKIYPQVLAFFIKPQIWLFHVAVLQTTAKKWTKVKNMCRACKAIVFCKFVTFSSTSPLSLLKLPLISLVKSGKIIVRHAF